MKPGIIGPASPLANARGSTLLMVMVAAGLAAVGVYVLSQSAILQKKQVERTFATTNAHLTVHSLLDYSLFALKQRWCLSETMLPDASCSLQHPANIERLVMTTSEENFIKQMVAAGTFTAGSVPNPVHLNSIEVKVPLTSITQSHPLWTVAAPLMGSNVGAFDVKMERDTSPALPAAGGQIFLRVTASMIDATTGKVMVVNNSSLSAQSLVGVYPRELSSFALVLPGSLRLGTSAANTLGDVSFPAYGTKSAAVPGILFQSPVFVNRDISLPNPGSYTPVIFSERVYLGDGQILQNGAPYVPPQANDGNQLWAQQPNFGGFLKGIENDGARDAGLDYLSGVASGPMVTGSLMQQCIQMNLARSDWSQLKNASLLTQVQSVSGNRASYLMGLNNLDAFVEQDTYSTQPDTRNWGGQADLVSPNNNEKPVARVTVNWNGQTVSGLMSRDSTLTLTFGTGGGGGWHHSGIGNFANGGNNGNAGGGADAGGGGTAGGPDTGGTATSGPAQLILQTGSATVSGSVQPQLLNLTSQVVNGEYFIQNNLPAPVISFQAFDPGYFRGQPISQNQVNSKISGYLVYGVNAGGLQAPQGLSSSVGSTPVDSQIQQMDEAALEKACNTQTIASSGQAFGGASWNVSFTEQTRHSWNFQGAPNQTAYQDPLQSQLDLTANNSDPAHAVVFNIYSIVGTCNIKSDAVLVAGFLTCDVLNILPRTKPLTIIGTIIVGKQVNIDSSAYQYGVNWSSIYGTQATAQLRAAKVLAPTSDPNGSCSKPTTDPVWNPIPSISGVADRFACNVVSLRAKADPFRWTAVDPDCGFLDPNNSASHSCKDRVLRSFVIELSRESAI